MNRIPRSGNAWRKHGVIFEPGEPWETEDLSSFPGTVERTGDGGWRLWYTIFDRGDGVCGISAAVAEGTPGGPWRRYPIAATAGDPPRDAAYAVGNLPAGWEFGQPVCMYLEREQTYRLYFWAHAPPEGVIRFLAADSDDGRLFRVIDPHRPVLYHPLDRAVDVPYDHMGLTFAGKAHARPAHEPPAPPELVVNDATTVYALPDGTVELYTAALESVPPGAPGYIPDDNAAGRIRVIDRFTSADGLHFTNRTRVIARDDRDPPDQQFYYLSVIHTAAGRVGLLGHYACKAQTMDIEWCFSEDGIHWERNRRHGWLPRSAPGKAVDSYRVYAPCNMLEYDGQWWLFYTGCNYAHNHIDTHGRIRRRRILLAAIDRLFE